MAEIDTILDNQEVTAQTLNDIAVDLGNTSFNGFGENKFGADELNGITSSLVSSGILSSDNKCQPYISGNKVYINTGVIAFANGAKKKITEPVELELIANTYIYALNDTAHNICKIIVSEAAPTDNDFVNLCEIDADGTLIDKRMIAKAKVELPTEGNSYSFTETIPKSVNDISHKIITFPIVGISKIIIHTKTEQGGYVSMYEYDISSQKFNGVSFFDKHYQYLDKTSVPIQYEKNNRPLLEIYLNLVEQTSETVSFEYTINNTDSGDTPLNDYKLNVDYFIFGGIEKW